MKQGRVLVIGGPTASGKTELAIAVAEAWDAAIASADAMTVYRGLDVGTAKPPAAVLAGHPHACIDVRDLDEEFSVADFVAAVADLRARHPRVVVVGGTPFYLAALVRPLARLPAADPAVRAAFELLPDPWARLAEVDPPSAARLHRNDRVRIIRALEVHALSGWPLSKLHDEGAGAPPFPVEVAWVDRPDIRQCIDLRLVEMAARGYVEETRRAVLPVEQGGRGWDRSLKPLRSFAYRHIVAHVLDGLPLDEALRRTARDTWRLARKQRTWGRAMGWVPVQADGVHAAAQAAFETR